jgi:hypothetical protein
MRWTGQKTVGTMRYPWRDPARLLGGLIVLCLLHGLTAEPTQANGAEFGFGVGSVFPLETESVQLQEESVDVWLPTGGGLGWNGSVQCLYTLRNLTGEELKFTMGFVTDASAQQYPPAMLSSFYHQAAFSARVGRQAAPIEIWAVDASSWPDSLGSPPDSIPVWRVTIGPNATENVEIRYHITAGGGAEGNHIYVETTYRARPAALWAGTISRAKIIFRLDPLAAALLRCSKDPGSCVHMSITPAGYQWLDESILWQMTDWEPEQDFQFAVDWYGKDD